MSVEPKRKIVVGVTGASGAPYARRLFELLAERARTREDIEVGVCISGSPSRGPSIH